MQFRRATRVLTSWIAVLAILVAALAPSISHALAGKNGTDWIEVCSAAGAKWINADDETGNKSPVPSGGHPFEDCAYCSLHAKAIAIPAAPTAAVPFFRPGHGRPIAFLAAPRTLHAWVSAQPRAPPLIF